MKKKKLGFDELIAIIGGFVQLRYLSTDKVLIYDQEDYMNYMRNPNPHIIEGFQVFGIAIICDLDMVDKSVKSHVNYSKAGEAERLLAKK